MSRASEGIAFIEGIDETSLLLVGMGLLLSLLTVQIVWAYFQRNGRDRGPKQPTEAGSKSQSQSQAPSVKTDRDREPYDLEARREELDDGMMICPECSRPTEVEYKYCKHCISETGKGYIGNSGSDDSSQSGMF